MHVGTIFENFAPFILCPNHERVHGTLDVRFVVFVFSRLTNDFGTQNASFCKKDKLLSSIRGPFTLDVRSRVGTSYSKMILKYEQAS